MKISPLQNALEVSDVDLYDDEACRELGRLVAHECVVVVRQAVPEERLHAIQMLWGQPGLPIINRYILERRLKGPHWRDVFMAMGAMTSALDDPSGRPGMARVSPDRDKRGRYTGAFPIGELDWHCDQQGYHDHQRVVGLMSIKGSKNSQTSFLCTAPGYDALNHEDRSLVDELITVWAWDDGTVCADMVPVQRQVIRYSGIPHDGMETPLLETTATGRRGARFPSHCFSHFKGMSRAESIKLKDHLWEKFAAPENVYTHDWHDGEIVFMDQNITLHARPTHVHHDDTRTMSRMISYMDRLFPGNGPADHVLYNDERLSHERFAEMVDAARLAEHARTELVPSS